METETKWIKNYKCHEKVISVWLHRTKRLHYKVVSFRNTHMHTYINPQSQSGDRSITQYYTVQQPHTGSDCKYNQYSQLNLIMGYKQNDVVVINTKNNKEDKKLHIHTPCTQICIYSKYIITKYRERNSFMTRSFIFIIIKIVLLTESFILYNKGRFYSVRCILPSILTNSDTY